MAIKGIYFDMDGTIANLYGDPNWLAKLRAYDATPYENALPMLNMSLLARYIHQVQKKGIQVGIISWLSKTSTTTYDIEVTNAKMKWLAKHLPSVVFDEVRIVAYGTPKATVVEFADEGILFDDELANRLEWGANAFEPSAIIETMKRALR